jgi:hypothetical protein
LSYALMKEIYLIKLYKDNICKLKNKNHTEEIKKTEKKRIIY